MGILFSRPSANLPTEGSSIYTEGEKPPLSTFQRIRKNAGLMKSRMFAPKDEFSRGIYHKYNNFTVEDLEPDLESNTEQEEEKMKQIYEDDDNDENDINVEEASFCLKRGKEKITNTFLKDRCEKYNEYNECMKKPENVECENTYNEVLIKYLKDKRNTKKNENVKAIKEKIKENWEQYGTDRKERENLEDELRTLNKEHKSIEQLIADIDNHNALKDPNPVQISKFQNATNILEKQGEINNITQPRLERCNQLLIDIEELEKLDPKTEKEKEEIENEIEKLNNLLLKSCNYFKGGKRISRTKHKKQRSRKLFQKKIFQKSRKLFPKNYSKKLKKKLKKK